MYGFIFYFAVIALVRAVRGLRAHKQAGLCSNCSFAHIQYAANAKRATSCTFGGGVRLVKLDVLYCTDFRNRYEVVKLRAMGFRADSETVTVEAGSA
jgi:hypothetical protein